MGISDLIAGFIQDALDEANGVLELRKHEDRCIFCESKELILAFRGKHICLKCLAQLKKAR